MKPSTVALVGGLMVGGLWLMARQTQSAGSGIRNEAEPFGPTARPLYDPSRLTNAQQAMAELIRNEAETSGLDPAFMICLAVTESSLDPAAIGDDGLSYGLFQLNKRYHPLPDAELLDPIRNTDTAMVEMLALIRRFPGNTYGDYAEAWTLGGSGRFVQKKRNPTKRRRMSQAIDDLALNLSLSEVPRA